MILQALMGYYERRHADAASAIAPFGFSLEKIGFVLVLNELGALINVEDVRELQGKRKVPRQYLVPQGVKKTSGIAANLLWDNAEYVLGLELKGKPERVVAQHQAFIARIIDELLPVCDDIAIQATAEFLRHTPLAAVSQYIDVEHIKNANTNLTFRLQGDTSPLICQRSKVVEAISRMQSTLNSDGFCLVTGYPDTIARLHPSIKGVWGAQPSGANIVSFNLNAFTSYGKDQGFNAPVGEQAAFAYTTALNELLQRRSLDNGSIQCLQVGDASTVFWAEKANPLENSFGALFAEPPKDNPAQGTEAVRALYKAVEQGGYTPDDRTTRFYVLGLAPNASRLAIRFWQVATVAELSKRVVQHFQDLEIIRPSFDDTVPSLFRLLTSIAVQGKADNIPPNLAGDTMRALLAGTPYPYTLLQAAIRRNRAEQRLTPNRAALIKACLNRLARQQQQKELTVALNKENPDVGYRLGRLFATLEKIQEEAHPGINATIRDRFYGAASSSPLSVFSNLMKLKNHHLANLDDRGRTIFFEKLIGEILQDVTAFPAQLSLPEQGQFAIGYYHQQQNFYTSTRTKGE